MKPSYLFLLLGLIAAGLSLLFGKQSTDVVMHDTFVIIELKHFFIPIFILSVLTALCYWIMDKVKKPISLRAGYWHFGLIASGLLFSFSLFRLIQALFNSSNAPDAIALGSDIIFLIQLLLGPLLLLAGLIIFIIALINAVMRPDSS